MKKITEGDIRSFFMKTMEDRIEDSSIPPDIVITEENNLFMVTITSNPTINTGKGGLQMFLKACMHPFLKIKYNGKILSIPETEEFVNRYKNIST